MIRAEITSPGPASKWPMRYQRSPHRHLARPPLMALRRRVKGIPTPHVAFAVFAGILLGAFGCSPTPGGGGTTGNGTIALLAGASFQSSSKSGSCLGESDIAGFHIVVDKIEIDDTNGASITVLNGPLMLDVESLTDAVTVLGSVTLPAGDYAGGAIYISSAELAYASSPSDYVPVNLPQGGVLVFAAPFTVDNDSGGVIRLRFDNITVCPQGGSGLVFGAEINADPDVQPPGPSNSYPVAETVEVDGTIAYLSAGNGTFNLKIGKEYLFVDASVAQVLLSKSFKTAFPTEGTIDNLANGQKVRVAGTLTLESSFVLLADSVEVLDTSAGGGQDTFDEFGNTIGFGIPNGLTGNATSGSAVWDNNCAVCHPNPFGTVGTPSYTTTLDRLTNQPLMSGLDLTNQEVADVTAFLNWSGGPLPPPPTAPDAPTNLQASDGTYSDHVALTWDASPSATGYKVWRNTSNDSESSELIGANTAAAFDDTTAVSDVTYYYWVRAKNAVGSSAFSAPDTGFSTAAPPPQAGEFDEFGNTTGFGIPAGLVGNATTGSGVWSNKCAGCHPSPFGAVGTPLYTTIQTKLTSVSLMSGLTMSNQQIADVTAYLNWTGGPLPPPQTAPAEPLNVQASDGTYPDRVALTWGASSGATSYEVWRNTANSSASATMINAPTVNSYDDSSVTADVTYYYWVKAVNNVGPSGFSIPDTGYAASAPPPPPPGGAYDEFGNTTGFNIPAGLVGNATTGSGVWVSNCTGCHPTPFGTVGALPYDTIQNRLTAVPLMSGLNMSSQQVADITAFLNWTGGPLPSPQTVPDAPTNVQASDGTYADHVAVAWSASANTTGYEVWRATANDSATATLIGTPVATSFDDIGAVADVTYYYWVKAVNNVGPSGFSIPDTGYAASAPPPPPPGGNYDEFGNTTGFNIPAGLVGNATTGNGIWTARCTGCHPTPFGAVGALPFDTIESRITTVPLMSGLNLTQQELADITAFLNWPGGALPPPQTVPDAPTNVQASDGTYTDRVAISWNLAAGATNYEVWRNTANDTASATLIDSPTAPPFDDTSATADVTYYYWVVGVNTMGAGFASAPDTGYRASVPPPPPSGDYDEFGNTTGFGIPAGLVGNVYAGTTIWTSRCTGCHPSPYGAVGPLPFATIEMRMTTVPLMSSLNLTQQELADITASLNWTGGPPPPPSTPPNPPTNVAATDALFTDRVRVLWNEPIGAASYEVWRNTSDTPSGSVEIGAPSGTYFDDTSASVGTTYFYWVVAVNPQGPSQFSLSDAGSKAVSAPTMPSGFDQFGNTTGFGIPSSTPGNAATGQLQFAQSCSACHPTPNGNVTGHNYGDINEAIGQVSQMQFLVLTTQQKTDIAAHLNWRSSSTRPPTPLRTPTGVSASDGTSSTGVHISWTAVSGAGSYEVWRNTGNSYAAAALIGTPSVTAFDDDTAALGTTYYYWIKASSANGTSAFSAPNSGYR